jgi:quercetin dioxygenase-like cupin family protein
MEVQPKKPSAKGPVEWFTGEVWIDAIARPQGEARLSVSAVHFTPGARTAWHSHSLGQVLFVVEGHGLVQSRDEPIVAIRPGDVVHTPADEWHWHGATPDHLMTHLSMTEGDAHWGDHVTDAEYRGDATT